jgi:hypothetical protein
MAEVIARRAAVDSTVPREKDDEVIEWQFVKDYGEFALQMNFLGCAALLEKARSVENAVKRKSICLSGLQFLYSSYEDFAILLHAFRNRIEGKHLHLTIGVEDQRRLGSTDIPRIFKHYEFARQMLDNFGFTSITHERLSQYMNISEEELESHYEDIADSIKGIGDYQGTVNGYKNKLKHGKPVLEGEVNRKNPDHVLFLRWSEENDKPLLELHWLTVTLQQLEMALIQISKIYIRSLELLWTFMLHYYTDHANQFREETMMACSRDVIEQVRALGLESKGLT